MAGIAAGKLANKWLLPDGSLDTKSMMDFAEEHADEIDDFAKRNGLKSSELIDILGKNYDELTDAQKRLYDGFYKGIIDGFPSHPVADGAYDHLKNVEGSGQKGISGGHNMDEFDDYLRSLGVDPEDCIVTKTPHPDIPGVYEVKYQLPLKDKAGKIIIPIEYRAKIYRKTIYNSSIINDAQMYEWGLEAMKNGVLDGREITGYASNGLKFIGYLDENGVITNFYPVLN